MEFKEKSEMIDYLSIKFELIKQFRDSKNETSLELINILKDLEFDLRCTVDALNNRPVMNNWKYCNNGAPTIEGQVCDKFGVEKVICDDVLSIDFENKVVRTNNFAFNLGNELVQNTNEN